MVLKGLLEALLGSILDCPGHGELLRRMAAAVAFVAQATLLQDAREVTASVEDSDTGFVPTP